MFALTPPVLPRPGSPQTRVLFTPWSRSRPSDFSPHPLPFYLLPGPGLVSLHSRTGKKTISNFRAGRFSGRVMEFFPGCRCQTHQSAAGHFQEEYLSEETQNRGCRTSHRTGGSSIQLRFVVHVKVFCSSELAGGEKKKQNMSYGSSRDVSKHRRCSGRDGEPRCSGPSSGKLCLISDGAQQPHIVFALMSVCGENENVRGRQAFPSGRRGRRDGGLVERKLLARLRSIL